jgi:hypothetical protein
MPEQIGSITGIGDKATGANEITPKMMAAIFDNIIGHYGGFVAKDTYNSFNATVQGNTVVLDTGAAFAFGYVGVMPRIIEFLFPYSPAGAVYYNIYAEFNLSNVPAKFVINATAGAGSGAWAGLEDDLRKVNGVYQFVLFTVVATANSLTITDVRRYKPGVADSLYVNNLAIGYDANGNTFYVEKKGDYSTTGYFERKAIIFDDGANNTTFRRDDLISLSRDISAGDILEIHYSESNEGGHYQIQRVVIRNIYFGDGGPTFTLSYASTIGYSTDRAMISSIGHYAAKLQLTALRQIKVLITGSLDFISTTNQLVSTSSFAPRGLKIAKIYKVLGGNF